MATSEDDQQWITPEEAEARSGIDISTLYHWIRNGSWSEGKEYRVIP